jgi:antitoxin PrlF
MSKIYNLRSTKIGNSAGFRLPAELYREHPQFIDADGWIEVLSDNTAILHIEPSLTDGESAADDDDSLMMRLFLDFALAEALKNNDLQPYTTAMSTTARNLIAGVVLDDE